MSVQSVEGSSSEWSQASIEGEDHEEVAEMSEEELLQILDGQEPPLQECCFPLLNCGSAACAEALALLPRSAGDCSCQMQSMHSFR